MLFEMGLYTDISLSFFKRNQNPQLCSPDTELDEKQEQFTLGYLVNYRNYQDRMHVTSNHSTT